MMYAESDDSESYYIEFQDEYSESEEVVITFDEVHTKDSHWVWIFLNQAWDTLKKHKDNTLTGLNGVLKMCHPIFR